MTGVSRASVREAVRSLQAMGLIEVRRGQGTFVREIDSDSVGDAQLLLLLNDHTILESLIEARRTIEPAIVQFATERATDDDLAAMERALVAMDAAESLDEWRPAHLAFHQALVEATHNVIFMKFWGLITVFLKDSPLVTGSFLPQLPRVHVDIYEAIKARDGEKAGASMRKHIADMAERAPSRDESDIRPPKA
jgi:GntR family transcriptional repressor for pyruvate dehydrogenase complex